MHHRACCGLVIVEKMLEMRAACYPLADSATRWRLPPPERGTHYLFSGIDRFKKIRHLGYQEMLVTG